MRDLLVPPPRSSASNPRIRTFRKAKYLDAPGIRTVPLRCLPPPSFRIHSCQDVACGLLRAARSVKYRSYDSRISLASLASTAKGGESRGSASFRHRDKSHGSSPASSPRFALTDQLVEDPSEKALPSGGGSDGGGGGEGRGGQLRVWGKRARSSSEDSVCVRAGSARFSIYRGHEGAAKEWSSVGRDGPSLWPS